MAGPRVTSVNLVVADGAAAAAFLADLGVDPSPVAEGWEAWAPHHREVPVDDGFVAELDSRAFAGWWGGVDGATEVVVNLGAATRAEVDELHQRAVALGAASLRDPHDAFWGSRYAVVRGPGPLVVGFLSPRDPDHMAPSPEIADFA